MKTLKQNSASFSQRVSIFAIRRYQNLKPVLDQTVISVFGYASACKQNPTCSEYTIAQIRRHGTITGVRMGIARILSCH